MFVDDDVVASIGATVGVENGPRRFCDLGRSYVGSEEGDGIFPGTPRTRYWQWHRGDRHDAPPVLPVLALSVLAASRMHASEHVSSGNYYYRFRELTGLPSAGGQPRGFEETVVTFWRGVREWAGAHEDTIGRLLIPDDPSPPYVGYPISQALWRQADSDQLAAALWDDRGDEIGDASPEGLAPLAAHLVARGVVSDRARRVFTDDRFEEIRHRVLEEIISGPPPPGTAAADRVRVRRDVLLRGQAGPRLRPTFAVRRDRRWPPTLRGVSDAGAEVVARSPATALGYYQLEGVEPTADTLSEGFVVETELGDWRFEPLDLYVLVPHPELGLATTQLRDEQEAIVVARDDAGDRPGWPRAVSDPTIPAGWRRYEGLEPNARVPVDIGRRLEEAAGPRLELDGGLAIRPRTYLRFAPPQVVLPTDWQDRTRVNAQLDDVDCRLPVVDGRAQLDGVDLAEGGHVLRIESGVVSFTTTAGLAPSCAFRPDHATELASGRVLGAYLDPAPAAPRPRPVVVSSHATEVLLVGARVGQVMIADRRAPPRWLARTPVRTADHEVRADFDVVWVIERTRHGTHCRLIEDRIPTLDQTAEPGDVARWVEAVRKCLGEVSNDHPGYGLAREYMQLAVTITDAS